MEGFLTWDSILKNSQKELYTLFEYKLNSCTFEAIILQVTCLKIYSQFVYPKNQ